MREILRQTLDFLESNGFRLITMILVAILGLMTIKNLIIIVKKGLLRTNVDTTIVNLILTVFRLVLYLSLILYCLSIMNIPLTGFIAALSALTLAIGLAVQNIISSVANSIMLVAVKPFKVGDFVDINGTIGTIKEINLIHTVINTPDNKRVMIPNSSVFNSAMVNYSYNEIRRIDVKISVDYDADTELARKVLLEVCQNHPLVLQEPAPQVRWNAHNDSYLEFVLRVWCNNSDYWPVTWDLDEQACLVLQKNNINIPFPQITLSYRDPAPSLTNVEKKEKEQGIEKVLNKNKRSDDIKDKITMQANAFANVGNSEAEGDR